MEERKQDNKKNKFNIGKLLFRVFKWTLISVAGLLILLLLLIQIPSVQNYGKEKALSYLREKLRTDVRIKDLSVKFPKTISLKDIYIEDLKGDTLLFSRVVDINISMWAFFRKKINVSKISVDGLTVKVYRTSPQQPFNFDFIAAAFADEDEEKTEESAPSWDFSVGKIIVSDSHIIYRDLKDGNDLDTRWKLLETSFDKFDLNHSDFVFQLIKINGLNGYFHLLNPLDTVSQESTDTNSFAVAAKKLLLNDIDFELNSAPAHFNSAFIIKQAEILPENIDMQQMVFGFREASFDRSVISIQMNSAVKQNSEVNGDDYYIKITGDKIRLNQSAFRFDADAFPHQHTGIDYNHLAFTDLDVGLKNLLYTPDTLSADVQKASLRERSGLNLKELRGDFEMVPTGISFRNLLLKTDETILRKNVAIHYPSLDAVVQHPFKLGLDIDLDKSRLSMKDLLLVMPALKENIHLPESEVLNIDSKITGSLDNLDIDHLKMEGLEGTKIDVAGTVSSLNDYHQSNVNLDIRSVTFTGNDLKRLIPPSALPPGITLPDKIEIAGNLKGGAEKFLANLSVNSSLGNLLINGAGAHLLNENNIQYDIQGRATALQLDKLIQNDEMGNLEGTVNVKGRGLQYTTAESSISLSLSEMEYHGYKYRNIEIEGDVNEGELNAAIAVGDTSLRASFKVAGNITDSYPSIKLDGVIDSIDAQALHFTDSRLKYHGRVSADFSNTNPDSLTGKLYITKSIISGKENRVALDTISLVAASKDSNSIQLNTGFASLTLSGQYTLTQLPDILVNAVNKYYFIQNEKSDSVLRPYDFTINGYIYSNPVMKGMWPKLKELQTIKLFAKFSSQGGFALQLDAPHIKYDELTLNEFLLEAFSGDSALAVTTHIGSVQNGNLIQIYNTALNAELYDNQGRFDVEMKDKTEKTKYLFGGRFRQGEQHKIILSLLNENLILNYQEWKINDDNSITFDKGFPDAVNFILTNGQQELRVENIASGKNNPVVLSFSDFRIPTITGIVLTDSTYYFDGILDGKVNLENSEQSFTFLSDLKIQDLSMNRDTLGNLTVIVDNKREKVIHADISLKGSENDIAILGDYLEGNPSGNLDFKIDIKNFDAKSLAGISGGSLKRADGTIYGDIAVSGSVEKPSIDGQIKFKQTSFVPEVLNNVYKINDESVAFVRNEGIEFNSFSITDTAGNKLNLDGKINTTDWTHYSFDIRVRAQNFQAINSTGRDNELFYGKLIFSANIAIKGTPSQPVVNGSLSVDKGTDFSLVLMADNPEISERDGIVRFVDYSATKEDSLFLSAYDSLVTTDFRNYDVSLNLHIDKEAEFNMVVDPANGDFLRMRGTADLNGGIDPNGKVNLTGSYEIEEGSYSLTFNFLQRKFDIETGSKITWTGEPTAAEVDIKANYHTNTAPFDLVGSMSNENEIYFKQKLPFDVQLTMTGELLKPEINFDILLPDENFALNTTVINTVQEKLIQLRQEPAEMNKQVFALLLLNRFIGENPFQNGGGDDLTAATFAKQSASRLLSEQLNNIAQNLISGVDLDFDLASQDDYSSGKKVEKTNLKVNVSTTLLNDRLTVTVGNNFELEGDQQSQQQHTGIADNININYRLSKDGRYLLRAYRKNDYTGAIEGYIIESGIGFVITMDYDRFSELFSNKSRRRQKREIRRYNRGLNQKENDVENSEQTSVSQIKNKD